MNVRDGPVGISFRLILKQSRCRTDEGDRGSGPSTNAGKNLSDSRLARADSMNQGQSFK